jgi:predicted NBD/HSP70 family sugar kinase
MHVLVVDIGGTHIKIRATSGKQAVKIPSGPTMTPRTMVKDVLDATAGWTYDAVSLGYPGVVLHGKIAIEPINLARGWVGFNFAKALRHPVRILNDAAMQALGSYKGGRMLFLGLGTGLGTALILDEVIAPMEISHLPYKKGRTYEDYAGIAGLRRLGKKRWQEHVAEIIALFKTALEVDDVVVGGGNAKILTRVPRGVRIGDNSNAYLGGVRLWTRDAGDVSR